MNQLMLVVLMLGFSSIATAQEESSPSDPPLYQEELAGTMQAYDSRRTVRQELITWFNFKTEQNENMRGSPPAERMREFIPQIPAAQELYELYRKAGKAPEEAAILVLVLLIH